MALSERVYVLEVYCGHASVSKIMQHMLKCPVETIDMDSSFEPSMCMDALSWNSTHATTLEEKYPDRRAIVFASPPCQHYSLMRTTGPARDLEHADKHVRIIETIARDLNACLVFIENPATGLLRTREAIQFLPYKYNVDYCQYGFLYKKQTSIWSSIELRDFQPKTCPGKRGCNAMFHDVLSVKSHRHVLEYKDLSISQRIMVPDQLIVCLMRAAIPLVVEQISDPRRHGSRYGVNFVSQVMFDEDNNMYVKINWEGLEEESWVEFKHLDYPLEAYDFASEDDRDKAIAWRARQQRA